MGDQAASLREQYPETRGDPEGRGRLKSWYFGLGCTLIAANSCAMIGGECTTVTALNEPEVGIGEVSPPVIERRRSAQSQRVCSFMIAGRHRSPRWFWGCAS